MPTHPRLLVLFLLPLLSLVHAPALAQDGDDEPRFKVTGRVVQSTDATSPETFDDDQRDGRLIFGPQPDEARLRAFARDGGALVVSMRTDEEMATLGFDERALCDELGLEYVHIPMTYASATLEDARALGRTLRSTGGAAMLHCRTGSRASMLYALNLASIGAVSPERAKSRATDLGMSPSASPHFDRALMKIPQRVVGRVRPARLIDDVHMLASFGTRHTLSETEDEHRGIGAARRWVRGAFARAIEGHGKSGDAAPSVSFDAHTLEPDGRRITREVEVVNVVCTIPGSDPDARGRLHYVLAHLDSRASDALDSESDAPGANDDASGVAALIELARVLAPENLDATVVLMATSGEEQGLFGARLHAEDLAERGADVAAVLNNDTIGDPSGTGDRTAPGEVRIFSEGLPAQLLKIESPERLRNALYRLRLYGAESDSESRQLARYIRFVADLHADLPVKPRLIFRPDRYLRGGDHTPFNELGFAAVRFCEVHEDYTKQHQDVREEDGVQYGDLARSVDPEYLAGVTMLNAATLVHLTNAPPAPDSARIIVAELTTDTTLRWDPAPGASGYEIVWRATTDPTWTGFRDVGDATEATIDRSKDNWVFGVRAYDSRGYRSMAAFPLAARE